MPCSTAVRRANPNRPASDTWMVLMAAASAARRSQTPSPSNMRRLAFPKAVVRSSKLGWVAEPGAMPSTRSVERPVPDIATARLAPTMPPPMIATSTCVADIGRITPGHDGFDRVHGLWRVGSQYLNAGSGDQHIVLYANADVTHSLGHA